ncbi:MAG TPA: bifunctional DNA-binding transcriptional regulator/O6-methylguanine-DNA methyltransferase Ada [Candidatus Baltobacteraceae bacterium]|nr:bifunctional DNA-binding transcriptional regulator/O6-methylguanine-DNA methyltransferase Ada [Candidatus Baltobacteraceae bacterium]
MHQIDDVRWDAIAGRDAGRAQLFGVRTTRIYCRTGCPARTPARRNVVGFADAREARAAGYRPCKRCVPDEPSADGATLRLMERAAALLSADEPPSLADVARAVGLSRFHFQRVFRRVTGVTPGEYVRARRDERFRARVRDGVNVTAAIQSAGYGSASRAYEARALGMTPTRARDGGRGERIGYAIAACSLGRVLVATSDRGICAIALGARDEALRDELTRDFPHADCVEDVRVNALLHDVVALIDDPATPRDLALDVRGTAFQRRVWNALREVAPGAPLTYAALARAVGAPRSARAVGAACAANRLAVAIPCHRVLREDGRVAGYRWGAERKRALLARERAPAGEARDPAREGAAR